LTASPLVWCLMYECTHIDYSHAYMHATVAFSAQPSMRRSTRSSVCSCLTKSVRACDMHACVQHVAAQGEDACRTCNVSTAVVRPICGAEQVSFLTEADACTHECACSKRLHDEYWHIVLALRTFVGEVDCCIVLLNTLPKLIATAHVHTCCVT
jgi:hypothetical protein